MHTRVHVNRYAGGLRQPAHAHHTPHLSLVLAGGFAEQAGRAEAQVGAGQVVMRPDGMRHTVTFCARGAIVLTFPPPPRLPAPDPLWSRTLPRAHLRQLTPMLMADEDRLDAAWDLIALCQGGPTRAVPEPWLAAVRERLVEAPAQTLAALATEIGRHRVHLGRAFLAAYGETPSVFRRRAMLDRALCLIAGGAAPALAAAEAGFADQSHFNRACRDVFGLTPGALLRGAANVASVQYAVA